MRITLILGFMLLSVEALAQADSSDLQSEINTLNNVQHEFTTCAAYYSIVHQCVANRKKAEDGDFLKQLIAIRNKLIELGYETGKAIGMTNDAMRGRVSMEMQHMLGMMERNCVNIASLYSRHALRCKKVLENPDVIYEEYKNRN